MQFDVTMVMSDWQEDPAQMLAVWKFVSMRHGAQSVMTFGVQVMHQLSADSLVTLDSVSQLWICSDNIKVVL